VGRYLAVVFSDLERHSVAWASAPRDRMVAMIGEYRQLAEDLSAQYGARYIEWAGDGHMFLFDNVDSAARFCLKLLDAWARSAAGGDDPAGAPHPPLRVGCHFGECSPLEAGPGWIGRGNAVAKRVETQAEPDAVFVTEAILDLIDLPLYRFRAAGKRALKGDPLPRRALYCLDGFDEEAFLAKPERELSAEEWFLRAVSFFGTDRENSQEEAECYRRALDLRPDYPEAHNNYAVLLRRRGEDAAAAEHYREALRARRDYGEAHVNYAGLLASWGNAAGAILHYEEALAMRPEHAEAHLGLANMLMMSGRLKEAESHYREVLRLRPHSAEANLNLAVLLEDLGRHEEAAQRYEEALAIRPDHPQAHYDYALLLESTGDALRAEAHYRAALVSCPGFGEAHNNLAVILHTAGRLKEAAYHYQAAIAARPNDPETHHNLALLLRQDGRAQEADEEARTAAELTPDSAKFHSSVEHPA
jgi:tetratricopeptide (TPR) repeat protein